MRDLGGLLAGILNTARGWMDNSQKTLPGYAERIVAIHLYPGEGGMNLNMEATIIERLARRGLFGAHTLLRDWCSVDGAGQRRAGNQWHQHRWLRYRILMRELEELGREWKQVYTRTDSSPQGVHTPSMAELVASAGTADDHTRDLCYQWLNRDAACTAGELTNRFNAFAPISPQPDEPLSFD